MNNYEIINNTINKGYELYGVLHTPFIINIYVSPNENIWWFVLDDEEEYNNNFYGDKERYDYYMFHHTKEEAIKDIKEWLNDYEECTIDIIENRLWQLLK